MDANGFPSLGDFGNAFLKLSTRSGALAVADYFATVEQEEENDTDDDLGSGGTLVLPDLTDASGRSGIWRSVRVRIQISSDSMGKFNSTADAIPQKESLFSRTSVFHARIRQWHRLLRCRPRPHQGIYAQERPIPDRSGEQDRRDFFYPGATPSISANGTSAAILGAVEYGYSATLHAYDATDLSKELDNNNQAPFVQDQLGPGNKFITPTIANGRVYVGTTYGVAVFGLR